MQGILIIYFEIYVSLRKKGKPHMNATPSISKYNNFYSLQFILTYNNFSTNIYFSTNHNSPPYNFSRLSPLLNQLTHD